MSRRKGFARIAAERTQCPKGHPYDDQNTIHTKNGRRRCRVCVAEQTRAYTARKRAERPPKPPKPPTPPATHCLHGHAWTLKNTYVPPNGNRQCRQCQHARNTEHKRQCRSRNKALIVSLKGNRCTDCSGEFMSRELHFHHLDPSTKTTKVSALTARGTERAIREEIAKCAVVCVSCHERIHCDDEGVIGGRGRVPGAGH